jgi:hypothetical protein
VKAIGLTVPDSVLARADEVIEWREGRFKMKLPRRNFLHLAAGAAALPVVSRIAWAQTYPTRPVRIIISFPAGQASDTIARLMGQSLSERLGQPITAFSCWVSDVGPYARYATVVARQAGTSARRNGRTGC